jgi:co-chaperonin GroES (HSP10)
MKDRIFPLNTKILIRANETEKRQESLIVIPDEDKGEYRTATAMRVGPDVKHIEEGYTIFVDWRKCIDMKIQGTMYCMVDEADVVAIVSKY